MLGSPAGPGGPSQRGGLWPIAPVTAPSATSFATDGFSKYGVYSLFPGGPNFGSALYSHSAIGRFTSGSLQSSPTAFHAAHKDSLFSSSYTLGAPTPPPGSPYSPVPVTQLELLAKGFNSNIIIQQPEYPLSPKKPLIQEKRCEDKCCTVKPQRSCICNGSPAKTKFVDNSSGCSRTNPVEWSHVNVKKEPGTPCQVAEITTSVSPIIKVEVTSPTQKHALDVHSTNVPPVVTTNGNIPVGIAVARQRIQHHEVISSPSLPPAGLLTTVNTQYKEMSRMSEMDSTPGMAASTSGGVPGSGTLLQCTDDRSAGLAGWPIGGTHNSALSTPTLWQYPAPLPMEPVVPMSVPIPPVGFQLVRDPTSGGLLLLPTTEHLQQALVWPSYHQHPSHVLLPQLPPPPLQLLSSASSDYLSTSTTLHQHHTQTHSTRLVAVTTDTKRKIPLPIPATTLIKIETDASTLDQTKTLQAVSTIASNTGTVFTDQNVGPLVTTHVIYQHPTNLILSQTPAPETACRSQATSPVICLTPPPENNSQLEDEVLGVQDASNQTDSPICSEDDNTTHAMSDVVSEPKTRQNEEEKIKEIEPKEDHSLFTEVPEKESEVQEQTSEVMEIVESPREQESFVEEPYMIESTPTETVDEVHCPKLDLSGLELLSNSIVEFENCLNNKERFSVKQEKEDAKGTEQSEEVLNGIAHMTLKDQDAEILSKKVDDSLGGLDLLCALAEQRILEEVTEKNKVESQYRDKEKEKHERKKEKRKSRKHSDEPKHKKLKHNGEDVIHKSHKNKYRFERFRETNEIEENYKMEMDMSVSNKSRDVETSKCTCKEDSYRTYKTRESEEEVKKFIASKSQPLCCKGDWPCMNPSELDMRMRLAELQKKYREKQRELNKLKIKKHAEHKDCSKKNRSRKKSINSDRSTPPPLLDKMDIPVRPNKNTQELLKPPTLCAFGSQESLKVSQLEPIKELDVEKADYPSEPEKCSDSPWYDMSDSTPEKTSSSKKRKVGRPKKLLSPSGLRTATETIVAKKPKKSNIVGYLLAAKEKLLQNKNGMLYANSPPRFVEETTTPKHKSHRRSTSSDEPSQNRKKHEHKKADKCKIRPKLKAEPMVKTYTEEEEVNNEWQGETYRENIEETRAEEEIVEAEVPKEKAEEVEVVEVEAPKEVEEQPKVADSRCTLTAEHLNVEKLRVLTAMGGLFYAGHLNAVEPPDVYSITLDGERGNRPHIMSREEILRDAIVEVSPASTDELTVGTRLCAYWSQQYRCLYPGSVAEPGTPDPILDSKFVAVEFDDGDSGRIALEDIRLLPPDYPIIEYDPNPLQTLSKRRRRTSTTEERKVSQAVISPPLLPPPVVPPPPSSAQESSKITLQEVEKENKDVNKPGTDLYRERKRLKKRKREKLKQKLLHEDKKKKKKHRCTEENCKHRKHHKKHRKHKKHHHNKESDESSKVEEITETAEVGEQEEEEEDEQEDSFAENGEQFPEYRIIANPEDEVTMDDILEAKSKKSKKIRDRQESCESRSKMSAFLPARQLWGWSGKGYRRPKAKGRSRKQFFKAIQRGKETILVGDSAVFLSTGRPDRPYIGRIEAMWEVCGTMVVKVKWFYHPEETVGCPLNLQYPGALFESPHIDENDVQTISHKCEVLPLEEYTVKLGDDPQRYATIYDNNDVYYLAGYYDPTTTTIKMEPGIPFTSTD